MPPKTGLCRSATMFAFCLSSVAISVGAEIKVNPNLEEVVIEGNIEQGDYDKVVGLLKTAEIPNVFLASSGGNLAEAMKIGHLVRSLKMTTNIPVRSSEQNIIASAKSHGIDNLRANFMCTSACFFVFVAGVDREKEFPFFDPILGIHRPYLASDELKALTGSQAMVSSGQLRAVVEAYLKEMGVSSKYADLMFSVSKDDIRWISETEFEEDLGGIIPELSDWIDARCDTRTEAEKEAWKVIEHKTQTQMTETEKTLSDILLKKMTEIYRCKLNSLTALTHEAHSKIFPD